MRTINISAAKAHFSRLIDAVVAGDEIVITRSGKPAARLIPIKSVIAPSQRQLGILARKLSVPDDFDAALPEQVLRDFEGR
jgi:prevent-host-death family protein